MCGRYTLRRVSLVFTDFDAAPVPRFEEFTERPLFNIAPSQHVPVVRLDAKGERTVSRVRWGLIPHWMKGKPKTAPINARAETAMTGGMFRQAFERRRCLVPADGFYEWQGKTPPKQPYYIRMKDDALFAFAGLWERWTPEEGAEPVDTFAILTTSPNGLMRPIHDRMPVIIPKNDYARWLDRGKPAADVADLLKPFDAAPMEAQPVGRHVNSPKNDGPECVAGITSEATDEEASE